MKRKELKRLIRKEVQRELEQRAPVKTRQPRSEHRYDGDHRAAREDTAFGGRRVYCECGWVTLAFRDRAAAREAFAVHLDEMQAARSAL